MAAVVAGAPSTTEAVGSGGSPLVPTTIHRVKSEKTYEITPINFKYIRPRMSYGRQPQFLEDHSRIHCGLRANKRFRPLFVKKGATDENFDTEPLLRNVLANTTRAEYKNFGVLHVEGAWPKEVNIRDVDMVEKARKKMQRDETCMAALPVMTKEAEFLAKYNNTLSLYDRYFEKNTYTHKRDTMPFANVVNVYRCPSKRKRPVSKITFAPENVGRMAVAYCPFEFDPAMREHSCEAYFWEVENPTRPEGLVRAAAQIVEVRYHPQDVHSIVGALFTGQVATWDNRIGPNPQYISEYDVSHSDVCTSAQWVDSDTGMEFFSSGLDGQVIWWDERNLSEPLDSTWADPQKGRCEAKFALPVRVLEYEHALPTQFLVGTQFGQLMSFTKEGEAKNRLINVYRAHKGPVRSLHRNPVYVNNFMSCGDYHIRIFAEDCCDSAIMWTAPSQTLYTYCHWLTGRPCGMVASRLDGCLEFWDVLLQGGSSILTTKVSEDPLSTVCSADTGQHVASGTVNGDIRMVKVCEFMQQFEENDMTALGACFERESRREKYLEMSSAEPRRGRKDQPEKDSGGVKDPDNKPDPFTNPAILVDKKFFVMLAEEKRQQGVNAFPDKKQAARAYTNVLHKGKMEKKKMLLKSGTQSGVYMGGEQAVNLHNEAVRAAKEAAANVDNPEGEEEDTNAEVEEDEDGAATEPPAADEAITSPPAEETNSAPEEDEEAEEDAEEAEVEDGGGEE